ncbi:MAG: hypothetical protein AAGJ35_06215 [Myxococcota bacterium]
MTVTVFNGAAVAEVVLYCVGVHSLAADAGGCVDLAEGNRDGHGLALILLEVGRRVANEALVFEGVEENAVGHGRVGLAIVVIVFVHEVAGQARETLVLVGLLLLAVLGSAEDTFLGPEVQVVSVDAAETVHPV